jgi:NAD(P)-dependent dehydrogenase (short-subunit alcohol dehydrogenase family)
MTDKVVVITGSNAGIGLETAVALASMGATVVMTARDKAKGLHALAEVKRRSGSDRVELGDLDLASFASIRAFAQWLLAEHSRIDVLINNAGLILGSRQETEQGFETMFGVNHVGHFLLTDLLRDRLVASGRARVITVSSVAHHWAYRGMSRDDLAAGRSFRSSIRYGQSKLANILFTTELAKRFEGTAVTANCLHPGSINSHFGGDGDTGLLGWFIKVFGGIVLKSPMAGAMTSVHLASSEDPKVTATSGAYFANRRRRRPSRRARNAAEAAWLWEETERLVAAAS